MFYPPTNIPVVYTLILAPSIKCSKLAANYISCVRAHFVLKRRTCIDQRNTIAIVERLFGMSNNKSSSSSPKHLLRSSWRPLFLSLASPCHTTNHLTMTGGN